MTEDNEKMPEDMSLEELHEHYSEMLATANDLGFQVPDELLVETDDEETLRATCAKLDDAITAFRAGIDVADDSVEDGLPPPEKKPRRTSERMGLRAPAEDFNSGSRKKRGSGQKVLAKKPAAVLPADHTEDKTAKSRKKSSETPSAEESTMAKTATAKKTAKAPAKKTAKKAAKAAPAKKTASGVGRPAHKYKEGARIKVLVDENPCRAGSGKHERVARILKFDGKLVDDFVKAGGKTGSLRFSEEQKWIKII